MGSTKRKGFWANYQALYGPFRWYHKLGFFLIGLTVLLGIAGYIIYGGGKHQGPGEVHDTPLPPEVVEDRWERQEQATKKTVAEERPVKQILFGDFHVHTTFSTDAFMRSLPLFDGEGAHPPADACDYARFCSGLDFFALTDHAEGLTPLHWRESIETMQRCNAVAGDKENPDLVAFMGYEWTQVGRTAEEHFGHKNVIFKGIADHQIPKRPIAAEGLTSQAFAGRGGIPLTTLAMIPIWEWDQRQPYLDVMKYRSEVLDVDACPEGVDTTELPDDCREFAATPGVLFEKLEQGGYDSIVIPHGTTWGLYTPPGYTWDKQLKASQDDPDRQTMIEIFSGHGNSEEYRDFRALEEGPGGELICPEPTADYEPCCWRAGEIMRSRCDDPRSPACEEAVQRTRVEYLHAGSAGRLTVPGTDMDEWKGCGRCTDCFLPAFNYRPGGAAQYILARGNFDDPSNPRHSRMAFMASSDNHSARPGTGYKDYDRRKMTEATGARSELWRDRLFPVEPPVSEPRHVDRETVLDDFPAFRIVDFERQSTFFLTGGLIAVHSDGRNRAAIWDALERREVYGTSGDRILLWFDLVNGPMGRTPMGAEVAIDENPRFVAHAIGSFEQKPGCPTWSTHELSAERLDRICAGECYNPSDTRRGITRIEIVRIRPQIRDDEPVGELIDDPWKVMTCPGTDTCRVSFEDPEFLSLGRTTSYYARAIQEPTPAINADNVRCLDEACTQVKPCYGDYRTDSSDDCLAENEERAWSSPIWVNPKR